MHDNPLLETKELPAFDRIEPRHVQPAVEAVLAELREKTEALLAAGEYSWERTLRPLEELEDRLHRVWSPVSELHNVADSEELRRAYDTCLPRLAAYAVEKFQNERLYRAFLSVARSSACQELGEAEKKVIDNALRDFRLAGIELEGPRRKRLREIKEELARLQSRFEHNVLDATQAWKKQVRDPEELRGLPPSALALARQAALREGKEGWLLGLDWPSYRPVLAYCENCALREEMYTAYVTRASDAGPQAGLFDNSALIDEILRLRFEMARLLGYAHFAEYSLATKMAKDPEEVLGFLQDLVRRSRPVAEREFKQLRAFAAERYGVEELQAWDVPYYSERLREERYALSQEALRPYFPVPAVLAGLFEVARRLYGVEARRRPGVPVWHPEVQFFVLEDGGGTPRGMFYLDLYARAHKRAGAWMGEGVRRCRRADGTLQLPVAYVNCNFTPPLAGEPSLLTHEEVLTLFHEFGHALHHLLTAVDRPSVAGMNGVPWDAVELPSQFMENWCWEQEGLALLSRHYRSGAPLDPELVGRLKAAKNFHCGLQMLRQLELALFDFRLHMEYDPAAGRSVQAILEGVRREVSVIPTPAFNRLQHSFAHVFAGPYAAAYYSYKWAEVLSADAYARFEERGPFDAATGREFLKAILEPGGSRDAMEMFVQFRGRKPTVDALLRHSGIAA